MRTESYPDCICCSQPEGCDDCYLCTQVISQYLCDIRMAFTGITDGTKVCTGMNNNNWVCECENGSEDIPGPGYYGHCYWSPYPSQEFPGGGSVFLTAQLDIYAITTTGDPDDATDIRILVYLASSAFQAVFGRTVTRNSVDGDPRTWVDFDIPHLSTFPTVHCNTSSPTCTLTAI